MAKFKVVCGDCRTVLKKQKRKFHLGFCDPPFNVGEKYDTYTDLMPDKDYWYFTLDWVWSVWDSLTPNGILCLHGPDKLADYYLQASRCLGFWKKRISWIIWHYRFGQHQDANWINSHCHCLIFAKDPNEYTWNPEAVKVESDRSSTYDDPRTRKTKTPGRRVPLTVWGVPSDGPFWGRVQGNSGERRAEHPNQLPERYLERLLLGYTKEGDYVVDPFAGSGTTAVVALSLKRNVLTCDVSEKCCQSVRDRILAGAVRVKR
jgi:DNA modification methylase